MRLHHRGIILVSCVLIGLAGPKPAPAFFHEAVIKAFEDADNAMDGSVDPEPEASPSEDPSKTGTVDWNEPGKPGADPYFKNAFNTALENARKGSESPWLNPQTGDRGVITPVATFKEADGTPCRNYRWTLITGASSRLFEGTACRAGASNWRVKQETEQKSTVAGEESGDMPWLSEQGTDAQSTTIQPGAATSQSSYNHDKQMVADAQRMLNQLGYNAGAIDGQYGIKTRVAITAFHQDRGLPAGGNVTPQLVAQLSTATQGQDTTQEALADAAPSHQQQPQIQPADSPRFDKPWVTEIQTLLTSLGYNPGPADGAFGNKSQTAITAFQQQRGDPVTGLPTPSVMQALRSEA
ncbi:MAG: hypothetical protein E2O89_01420, partial [Alphaproteobacteria bacterium]